MRPLRTAAEYADALAELGRLMDANPPRDTPNGDRLELLALLVEDWERRTEQARFPLDPVEAIRFRMEQQGLRQRDLIPYIGSRPHTSEIMNRKRSLSLPMIRRLHTGLGIPLRSLIGTEDAP